MKTIFALMFFAAAACAHAAPEAEAPNGLVATDSAYSFDDTVTRLEAALAARQLKTFMIDHAENAAGAGLSLRPTALYIFGNPKGGTPLMEIAPAAGIDLPLKMLIVEEGGRTRVLYNDIDFVARRHAIPADAAPLAAIRKLLADIAAEAAGE